MYVVTVFIYRSQRFFELERLGKGVNTLLRLFSCESLTYVSGSDTVLFPSIGILLLKSQW